jgi:hypothetical protein
MEEKQSEVGKEEGIGGKGFALFFLFFAVAVGYYLGIDYVLMVFAQNLPFPYGG